MYKRHRSIIALLAIVLILGILAACSGGDNGGNNGNTEPDPASTTPEPEPTPEPTPEPEPDPEPVELAAYSNIADADFDARFAQAATATYPHFSFKHYSSAIRNLNDTIEVDLVTPDIGFGANVADYRLGVLKHDLGREISDLAAAAGFDLNQFDPGLLQSVRNLSPNGELIGLPNVSNPIVLFYNKDIFDAFGVDHPTDGMTWDQVYDLAQQVTGEANGAKYVGFGAFHSFLFGSNQQSLPLIDPASGQATVNSDDFKKIAENLIRFYQIPGIADGYNPDGTGNDDLVRFYEQKDLAMVVSLMSSVNRPGFETVNWDMVTAPTFADLPGIGYQDGVNFNFISKQSENAEAAFQALAEYYSEENQIALAKQMIFTPLVNENVRSALGEAPQLQGKNVGAVYANQFAPTPTPHPTITTPAQNVLAGHFSKLITGAYASVDEMLAAAETAINEAIAAE